MPKRPLYAVLRAMLLGVAAAGGFVVVYVPLMTFLFSKDFGFIYIPIVAAAIWTAVYSAQRVDRILPPASSSY